MWKYKVTDSTVVEAAASFQKAAVRVPEDSVDEATFVLEKKIQSGTVRTKKDKSVNARLKGWKYLGSSNYTDFYVAV